MGKRIFDFFASATGLILLMPLFLILFLLIKLYMPGGPAIFRQQRVGRNGKLFILYKYRTMHVTHHGSSITVGGEDRITPLGNVLRKSKLDELPELLNVLIGDMSFVGPRPDVPGYADKLQGNDRKVLSLRPGITGPATLKFANEEELLACQSEPQKYNDEVLFPDKVKINLNYIENQSFLLDLKIILFTIIGKQLHESWMNKHKELET